MSRADEHPAFMRTALSLAEAQLGRTWPNPSVGALVVRDGNILARAATAAGGRPHAETQALAQAGAGAKGATLYVSLEPCSHQGQTPPCTDAIIASGIARCVVACRDANPQVDGIAPLREAGIEVIEGVCEAEARALNRGFFSVIEKKRPYIALKLATSADGKITTGDPARPWITQQAARDHGHRLRSRYDAIATGIGTVLADNPRLTCRLPGLEDRSPVRVVFDRRGRLPENAAVRPAWILPEPTLEAALATLTGKGITRLLVEAGQALSSAFLEAGVVDRIYWFKSPLTIGDVGMNALGPGYSSTRPPAGWKCIESVVLSPDTLDIFESCSPAS